MQAITMRAGSPRRGDSTHRSTIAMKTGHSIRIHPRRLGTDHPHFPEYVIPYGASIRWRAINTTTDRANITPTTAL